MKKFITGFLSLTFCLVISVGATAPTTVSSDEPSVGNIEISDESSNKSHTILETFEEDGNTSVNGDIAPHIMLNCTASYSPSEPIVVYNSITGANTGVKITFTAYGDYVVNDTTGKIDAAFTPVRYDAKVIGTPGHTVRGGETDENAMAVISSDKKTVTFYSRYRATVEMKTTGLLLGYLDEPVTIIGKAN